MDCQMAVFLVIVSALSYGRNSCSTMWLMRRRCVIDGIPWSHVYVDLYPVQGLGWLVQAGERFRCSLLVYWGPCLSWARFSSGLVSPPVSSGFCAAVLVGLV